MRDLKLDPLTANIGPVFTPIELESYAGLVHQRHVGAASSCLLSAVPIVTPSPSESLDAFIGAVISQLHQISMHLLDCAPLIA